MALYGSVKSFEPALTLRVNQMATILSKSKNRKLMTGESLLFIDNCTSMGNIYYMQNIDKTQDTIHVYHL